MKNNRYQKLAKNTAIFAIGTFGSKVLTFLIIPLYTYYLSTAEYGQVDLFSTTANLLVPFMCLSIQEALIRFILADINQADRVLSNSMIVFVSGAVLSVLLYPLFCWGFKSNEMGIYFCILLILTMYNTIFCQYLRSTGKNIAFSINGVLITAGLVFCNLFLLVGLKLGVRGYYLSLIFSQGIASIQATIAGNIFREFSIKRIDLPLMKNMVAFSMPLIPNSLMWWIMNAGDKYVIRYYLGASANGIYSVSTKVPTILTLLFSIFMQAWQISAIEEDQSEDRKVFYEKVFSMLNAVLVVAASALTVIIKPVFQMVISESFLGAAKYVPLLCFAGIINCLAGFLGIVYSVNMQSRKAFFTTFVGAAVNLIVNFALIQPLGLYGVAIGTIVGYIAVFVLRYLDMKSYIGMRLGVRTFYLPLLVLTIQIGICLIFDSNMLYLLNGLCFLACLILEYSVVKDAAKIFFRKQ